MYLARMLTPLLLAAVILLVDLNRIFGQEEECPCTWTEENREWNCKVKDLDYIPTQCWPLHEDVRRILFECWIPGTIPNDSFVHENLMNLEHLDLESAEFVPYEALNHLTNLTYLSLYRCHNEEVPDISNLLKLEELNLGENSLTSVPSLIHMIRLQKVNLAVNQLKSLPAIFLPGTPQGLDVSLYVNKFHEINASSIVLVSPDSFLAFDYLSAIWATEEEREILIEKQIASNIDIIGIIKIIQDPTDP